MARTEANREPTRSADLECQVPLEAVEGLREGLGDQLVAVVLFGSRARGDARANSDWDLLVVANDLSDNPYDRQTYLHRLVLTCHGSVSMIARTP